MVLIKGFGGFSVHGYSCSQVFRNGFRNVSSQFPYDGKHVNLPYIPSLHGSLEAWLPS